HPPRPALPGLDVPRLPRSSRRPTRDADALGIPTSPEAVCLPAGVLEGPGERVDVGAVVVGVKRHTDPVVSRADDDAVLLGEAGLNRSCGECGMAQRDDVAARARLVEISVGRPA